MIELLSGVASIAVGAIYLVLGFLALADLQRYRSLFGFGFASAAFTCGPHHLTHGLHQISGEGFSGFEAVSVVIGLPFASAFLVLRVSHAMGRAGDVMVPGRSAPLIVVALGLAVFGTGLTLSAAPGGDIDPLRFMCGVIQAISYFGVGWYLLQTQWLRRDSQGEWSLSGLSLVGIFSTCGISHLVYGVAPVDDDWHSGFINVLGVPASLFFLAVTFVLHRRARLEWARRPAMMRVSEAAPAPWSDAARDTSSTSTG